MSILGAQTASADEPASRASRAKTRRILTSRASAGYALWNERPRLLREADGRVFELAAAVRTVAVGYQWNLLERRKGWMAEVQGLIGDAGVESRDGQLTYFQNNASINGVAFTVAHHRNFEKPRLWIGLGLSVLVRTADFEAPEGYSFVKNEPFLHGKIDFSFPITRGIEIVQQFGIPIGRADEFWLIGVRF